MLPIKRNLISDVPSDEPADLTIVIAHRGEPMGLWATIHSCDIDLKNTGLKYNYSVVVNGQDTPNPELDRVLYWLEQSGLRQDLHIIEQPMSPPSARQLATESANGEFLFFFDNHCLVDRGYFERAIWSMNEYGMDMLHSTTIFNTGEFTHYHYELTPWSNFWGVAQRVPKNDKYPYRIAAGGHGGFVVRRSVWEEVDGYWSGFEGYGGEEIYFDLKMALFGKTNWIDPKLIHYHYASDHRGYERHYTDDFFVNMLMCANLIAGEKYVDQVHAYFVKSFPELTDNLQKLRADSIRFSDKHAQWIASKRVVPSFDALLEQFKRDGVAH